MLGAAVTIDNIKIHNTELSTLAIVKMYEDDADGITGFDETTLVASVDSAIIIPYF